MAKLFSVIYLLCMIVVGAGVGARSDRAQAVCNVIDGSPLRPSQSHECTDEGANCHWCYRDRRRSARCGNGDSYQCLNDVACATPGVTLCFQQSGC
jgi:hypothetical protein